METNDSSLQVYLKLNSLSEGEKGKFVQDLSSHHTLAQVNGDPTLTSDTLFANSLLFDGDGDFIDLAKDPFPNDTAFTISLWAHPSLINDGAYHALIGKLGDEFRKPGLWLGPTGGHLHYDSYDPVTKARYTGEISNFFEQANEWVHLVWLKEGNQYRFYRNGELFRTDPAPDRVFRADSSYQIGYIDNYWKGKVAHVRIYSRALREDELNWDRDEDVTAIAAFRRTHPLSFSLYNGSKKDTLYIVDDPTKQHIIFEVRNDAKKAFDLLGIAGDGEAMAGPDSHHFALYFRPGALSEFSFNNFSLSDQSKKEGWVSGTARKADQTMCLFFLHKTDLTFKAGDALSFDLANMSAEPKGGSRGSLVELHFRVDPHPTAADSQPARHRSQRLTIVNHSGQANFPIHIGPVGAGTVLNDGSSTSNLTFHFTSLLVNQDPANPGRSTIRFKGKNNLPQGYTKLILSVETYTAEKEWGLCTADQAKDIQPGIAGWTKESENTSGESPEWVFFPENDLHLAAGAFMPIALNHIISSAPGGLSRLMIRYENVPGYWDGQLVAPIMKSYLAEVDGKVGVGTNNPQDALQVGNYGPGDKYITVAVDGGNQNRAGLKLSTWKQDYGYIIEHNEKVYDAASNPQGNNGLSILWRHLDDQNKPVDKCLLYANSSGKVGINNVQPKASLDVKGPDYQLAITNEQNHSWGLVNLTDNKLYFQHREDGAFKNNAMWLDPDGGLTINGKAGAAIGDSQDALQVGNYGPGDKYITVAVDGGNQNRAGLKLSTWKQDYGYIIEHNEKVYDAASNPQGNNGLSILWRHLDDQNKPVDKCLLYANSSGKVGINNVQPKASLDVKADDVHLGLTNGNNNNWTMVNWTDNKLYFQYRENGVLKNNAMILESNGTLGLGAIKIGNTVLGEHEFKVLKALASRMGTQT